MEVRQRLGEALRAQFKKEIVRAAERIRTSIAPYSRFVRAEAEKLESTSKEIETVSSDLRSLRDRIERAA
ncbi:MAG TPA: hypothetical protein VM115_03000, partial [Vicinamibacterales bacterium]|nr:hypothetical protein [Vicinamibacterales bacterium]